MKKNPLIIIVILVVVIVAFWLISTLLKNKNTPKEEKKSSNPAASTTGTTSGQIATSVINGGLLNQKVFPIKRGSTGTAVWYVQKAINYSAQKNGIAGIKLTVDGAFGQNTEDALFKLYGQKVVDLNLAKRMARDADIPEFSLALNSIK